MATLITKFCANQFPGVLFNSAINSKGQLAIESRTAETTFFSIYNLIDGELLSEIQAINLTPWHSLAAIDEHHLILRYFENKQNPDHVTFFRYDPSSDQLMNEVDIDTINQPPLGTSSLFLPESEGFQMVTQFLDQPIVLGCEYLELDEFIIICYYLTFDDSFERKILVLKNGMEVLHEIQDKKVAGFVPGSFFTFQNRLIFVKEKTEINIYEMS